MIKSVADLCRGENFFLLAGPCVIEGEDMALRIAERVVKITDRLKIPYVFKGSYRKANLYLVEALTFAPGFVYGYRRRKGIEGARKGARYIRGARSDGYTCRRRG